MKLRSFPRPVRYRTGGVTPLTVLNLSLLIGVVALVVDGGTLMEARRHVQAAADAAALAGAADLYANYPTNQGIDSSGTALASALAIASANGFLNDGTQSTVTVNTSPKFYQGGPHAGQTIPPGYIEVLIQYNAPHLFSGVLGGGTSSVPGRAVARGQTASSANNALLVLSTSSRISGALALSSLASLNVNGGVQVNSSSSMALELSGGATLTTTQLTVNPSVVNLLGSISTLLLGPGGTSPAVRSAPPAPDPLRYLPAPDPVNLGLSTQGTNVVLSSSTPVDLYPGIYNGGIQLQAGARATLHANADGTPGIYYLNAPGGLQITGSASITTASNEMAGVMIYNNWSTASDSINLSGSGAVTLIPPASGTYRGLCIFQKRGTPANHAPTMTFSCQGNLNLAGTIYAAYGGISCTGSGTNTLGGQIIADTFTATGAAIVKINSGTQSTANLRTLGLVE